MSNSNFDAPTSQPTMNSHASASRRAMFKMLSETLRPAPPLISSRNMTKPSAANRINKKSPRTPRKPPFHTGHLSTTRITEPTENSSRASIPLRDKTSITMNHALGAHKSLTKSARGPVRKVNNIEKPFLPAPLKDCHLSNVLRSAKRCLHALRDAKDSLSSIVAQDEQLSRGIKKGNPSEDHLQLSHVALNIKNLCQQAFVPAHRLNQTAIALYSAEDFLRYPSDIRTFDLQSSAGRIRLPDMTFNNATVMKLRQVVDSAAETYNKFDGKGRLGEELQEVLFSILRAYQDYYAATLGCQEIFKVLLYTGKEDKAHLQQFLLALSPIDRSDMLVEIQDLRRILDEIVIFLEKLSWGSFVVYRLAGGNSVQSVVPDTAGGSAPVREDSAIPTYPAYPLLKAKGPKQKQKMKASEQIVDIMKPHSGVKLEMKQSSMDKNFADSKSRSGNVNRKSKFSKKKMVIAEEETHLFEVFRSQKRAMAAAPDGDTVVVQRKGSASGNNNNLGGKADAVNNNNVTS